MRVLLVANAVNVSEVASSEAVVENEIEYLWKQVTALEEEI